MNQELRLKGAKLETRRIKIMNRLELINQGSKNLEIKNIKSFRLDSEILLSKYLIKKEKYSH